jgi:hypothetical protein
MNRNIHTHGQPPRPRGSSVGRVRISSNRVCGIGHHAAARNASAQGAVRASVRVESCCESLAKSECAVRGNSDHRRERSSLSSDRSRSASPCRRLPSPNVALNWNAAPTQTLLRTRLTALASRTTRQQRSGVDLPYQNSNQPHCRSRSAGPTPPAPRVTARPGKYSP